MVVAPSKFVCLFVCLFFFFFFERQKAVILFDAAQNQ